MPNHTLPTGDASAIPPMRDGAPSPVSPPPLPARIGRYRIVRVLGEGGMGVVYEAQQDSPNRAVALKVIRAGYLSPQLLRRFEHESQVLGRLQHPGIAQVYEAGTVEDERGNPVPFFAMEFIRGTDLQTHCERNHLGTRDRLGLLARTCDAVDHAHQKGVIHRDLKPGNILIDESGNPKILDFGIARATDSDVHQTTVHTDVGQIIGTVPYMSPEQVGGDPSDLDTRSDVYALGVIAYELLAGRLPYDLDRKMIHDAARIIRETEPTRLSVSNRTLRGDVETIVAKALEKDKDRRYQSASALATDIRRYLKDEPIAARPASTMYQFRKFARRNKALVGGVAAVFIVLVGGIIATSLALVRVRAAEAGAIAERDNAREARDESEAVTGFLSNMLAAVNPVQGSKDVTVREILDQSSATIGEQFADQPVAQARLRQTIATSYTGLGDYKSAEKNFREALALRRAALGPEHEETLNSIVELGGNMWDQGQFDEAERLYTEALDAQRRTLGPRHERTLGTMANLGLLHVSRSEYAEAQPILEEAVAGLRASIGDEAEFTLAAMNNLALLYNALGRHEEAARYYELVIAGATKTLGADNPNTTLCMMNLGVLRMKLGELDRAEALLTEALESERRTLGEDHSQVYLTVGALARLRMAQGRLTEAEELATRALAGMRAALGEDHPDTAAAMNTMAQVLAGTGRDVEAADLFAKVVAVQGATPFMSPDEQADVLWRSGICLMRLHRFAEAKAMLTAAQSVASAGSGDAFRALERDIIGSMVDLYTAWHAAEPGKGYDGKAAEWKARLDGAPAPAPQ